MSASERSMRRMGRLTAIESAAEDMTERLWWLYRDLSAEGLGTWAANVGQIIKINALRASAEYARRNSAYFVRSGPQTLDKVEVDRRRREICAAADQIDILAAVVSSGGGDYFQFEKILERLRQFGFWIDTELVSSVARAFTLA